MGTLIKGARFFYLLWGGLLLGSLALTNRVRLPDLLWHWAWLARFCNAPWGRGLLLGIGAAMALGDENVAIWGDCQVDWLVEVPASGSLVPFPRGPSCSESHEGFSLRIQLDDRVFVDIGNPDIVVRIDAQPV